MENNTRDALIAEKELLNDILSEDFNDVYLSTETRLIMNRIERRLKETWELLSKEQ